MVLVLLEYMAAKAFPPFAELHSTLSMDSLLLSLQLGVLSV
jgi:hypothetical protein